MFVSGVEVLAGGLGASRRRVLPARPHRGILETVNLLPGRRTLMVAPSCTPVAAAVEREGRGQRLADKI